MNVKVRILKVCAIAQALGTGRYRRLARSLLKWPWQTGIVLLLSAASGRPADAPGTNAPTRLDFASFKVITDRNIFNANRSRGSGRNGSEARKPVRVDTFALVGALDYDKGLHAFFNGSSSDYRKALRTNGTIGGFKVKDITMKGVKLESGDKTIELRMDMQMRREDEGEWKMIAAADSHSVSSSGGSAASSGTAESSSSGEMSDIVKRMMQQREQESK